MTGIIQKGMQLPDGGRAETLCCEQDNWQIWRTNVGFALCIQRQLAESWMDSMLMEPGLFLPVSEEIYAVETGMDGYITSLDLGPYPKTRSQIEAMVHAYVSARTACQGVSLEGALYLSRLPCLLPVKWEKDEKNDALLLGRWVTGGMYVPFTDRERILRWTPALTESTYQALLTMLSWEETSPEKVLIKNEEDTEPSFSAPPRQKRKEGPFELPGRPKLEAFFRENILDIIDREAEYSRMGIHFPGATLLYGPPGSGKTYAVEQLADYLGWPVFFVNSSTIGSKYIHETSRLISSLFQQAIKSAPSIVVMDEMEAYLAKRNVYSGSGSAHMEEVAEFLRMIPELSRNHVLLFAMTNMLDEIDEAITRKGRFDHQLYMDYPSETEIVLLLENLMKDIPTKAGMDLRKAAQRLMKRPISDIAFTVYEAGRLAVVNRQNEITEKLLMEAIDRLTDGSQKSQKRRIGFFGANE